MRYRCSRSCAITYTARTKERQFAELSTKSPENRLERTPSSVNMKDCLKSTAECIVRGLYEDNVLGRINNEQIRSVLRIWRAKSRRQAAGVGKEIQNLQQAASDVG